MKIAVLVKGARVAFVNSPEDFPALAAQMVEDGVDQSSLTLSVPDLKTWATASVLEMAEQYRGKLASTSAGKLAEYRIKEEIAKAPTKASQAELALIDREAVARGIDRETLLGVIKARAGAFRQIALLIGALEAETTMAIAKVDDEDQSGIVKITAILETAQTTAGTAFNDAMSMIASNG